MSDKVRGPATYFPSIEKTYGHPVQHWFNHLSGLKGMTHMQMVTWLKTNHAMGHGHANALVAAWRAKTAGA
jgi:hypothetical protein